MLKIIKKTEVELELIENKYWEQEMILARMADSLGTTKKALIDNSGSFSVEIREQILSVLSNQADLLNAGHELKRHNFSSKSVVDLISYRQLLR